jgi:hydroxylaminobenzene mutase
MTPLQRSLSFRAALLFFIGMLTGVWAGAVLTEGRAIFLHLEKPHYERLALASHLNAVLGCFWILGVAWTIEQTRFGEKGKLWLARGTTLVPYANWGVTLVASFLDVRGLEMLPNEPKNNFIAVLLLALVVVPGLVASGAWAWGLAGSRGDA